jgi:segregation and condensation protein B
MKKRKRDAAEKAAGGTSASAEAPSGGSASEVAAADGAVADGAVADAAVSPEREPGAPELTADAVPLDTADADENSSGTVSGEMATNDFAFPDGELGEDSELDVEPVDVPEGEAGGVTDADPGDEGMLPKEASRIQSILESLLFAADRPLGLGDLKRLLGERDAKPITEALDELRQHRADSGIQLVSVAGGWQLRTHPANGSWVAKLVAGRPQRLSRAMMETLAIVAYRQPITRPEIDEIRGVDCGPVLRTLLDRGLIRVIGKKEEVGRPMLYGTTPEFLKTFSLKDLTELPTLREFHELGAAERAEVDATLPASTAGQGAAAPSGDGDPIRPSTVELPQADPAEDDALFEELDRATEAATRATAAPQDANANANADPNAEVDSAASAESPQASTEVP